MLPLGVLSLDARPLEPLLGVEGIGDEFSPSKCDTKINIKVGKHFSHMQITLSDAVKITFALIRHYRFFTLLFNKSPELTFGQSKIHFMIRKRYALSVIQH